MTKTYRMFILEHSQTKAVYPFDGTADCELSTSTPPKVFATKTTAGAARGRWEEKHPETMLNISPVDVTTL